MAKLTALARLVCAQFLTIMPAARVYAGASNPIIEQWRAINY